MKILDQNDVELDKDTLDYNLGYTQPEQKLIKHHEAIEATPEKNHYEVSTFYFEDGTSLKVTSQEDPHIKPVNPEKGVFDYVDLGEGKTLRGIDLKTVVDEESKEAKEAWDEFEDFLRWIPYSEEEIQKNLERQEQAEKQNAFLESGPDRLETTEINVDDLAVVVAELMGME